MRGWLLDTSVISELRKAKPNSRVEAGVPAFDPWTGALHINGKKAILKAPATMGTIPKKFP